MTKFIHIHVTDGHATISNEHEIPQATIAACPHFILVPEHYREDGTCRCNDLEYDEMREWGYRWRDGRWE